VAATRLLNQLTRWPALLVAALGANLWFVDVGVPVALHSLGVSLLGLVVLLATGPLALAVGLWRRVPVLLLVLFPATASLPLGLSSGDAPAHVIAAPPIVLSTVSLLAYLIAVAHLLSREASHADPPPVAARPLVVDVPARWRRRMRVYRGLTVVAIAFPLALVGWIDLRPATARELGVSFAGRVEAAQALFTVGAGLLWMVLLRGYLLAPLAGHLQHDREVLSELELARKQARRGRPRPAFYFAVIMALAAMLAVVWQRLK
jgi:hypothetical protein